MNLGGIYISARAKTDKLKRDLAKAKTMTGKAAVHMQNALSKINFARVGVAAAAFGTAYVYAMKKSIDAASDLQEVQGKFDVVFKAHKQQAEGFAKVLVDAYAMSSREAKQYLSSVQDLLVPMGMVSDEAAIMSNEVVKLAADLGSFNNLPTATVMLDIQSALVGNFETMKKYGVVLNETVIKQEAYNMGLYNGKGLVDANTKAQVAYKLMLQGSAAAQGDMARTSESYANQVKKLNSQIEEVSATIGEKLLPQVTEWVKQLNVLIQTNPQLIQQIGDFAEKSLMVASALTRLVIPAFKALKGIVVEMAPALKALGLYLDYIQNKGSGRPIGALDFDEQEALANTARDMKRYAKSIDKVIEAKKSLTKVEKIAKVDLGIAEEDRQQRIKWLLEEYAEEIRLEEEFLAEKLRLQQRAEEEAHRAAEKMANRRKEIIVDSFTSIATLMSQLNSTMTQMAGAGAKQSRSEFRRQKQLNMAQAAMATASAVTKALNFGTGGWAGILMASLISAMGAVQIATINRQEYQYAKGGIFSNSVIGKPTEFNNSIMGEAGPEAIMPLAKSASGELGVKASGGQPTTVNYMINAVDSKSFLDMVRRNPNAITAVINEQIQRGDSALMGNIKRAAR